MIHSTILSEKTSNRYFRIQRSKWIKLKNWWISLRNPPKLASAEPSSNLHIVDKQLCLYSQGRTWTNSLALPPPRQIPFEAKLNIPHNHKLSIASWSNVFLPFARRAWHADESAFVCRHQGNRRKLGIYSRFHLKSTTTCFVSSEYSTPKKRGRNRISQWNTVLLDPGHKSELDSRLLDIELNPIDRALCSVDPQKRRKTEIDFFSYHAITQLLWADSNF